MFTAVCYTLFVLCWLHPSLAEEEIDCGPPPVLERASAESQATYPLGSVVEYTCDYGYVASGYPKTSVCEYVDEMKTAEWSQPEFECVPRSCGDPGYVSNARRSGSLFSFGGSVEYVCDDGYILEGTSQRYCQTTGKWSGKLPMCKKKECEIPQYPENGRAIYDSVEYGELLQYECNKGFVLQPKGVRICLKNGQWNGTEPKCVEKSCDPPEAPLHGSVEIMVDRTTVGGIIIYSCDIGYVLHGSKTSKCFRTGEWTSPAPKCLELCKVPEIEHGVFGVYRGRGRKTFTQLSVGATVDVEQEIVLRCSKNYEPAGLQRAEIKITCSEGVWSADPVCKPAQCRGSPPSVPNADLKTKEKEHGTALTYLCKSGFVKKTWGSVKCNFGAWTGTLPSCKDSRCYHKDLKFSGLKPGKEKYDSGSIYHPQCHDGYELSKASDPKLTCNNGAWEGVLPPCKPAKCSGPPPAPENGNIKSFSTNHGSVAIVECKRGYQLTTNHSLPKCSFGRWESHSTICKDTRCHLKDLKPNEGVNMKDTTPTQSDSYGNIICLEGYELRLWQPLCLNGTWKLSHNFSPCKPQSCSTYYVENGEFQFSQTERTYKWSRFGQLITVYHTEKIGVIYNHGTDRFIACKNSYVFHGNRYQRVAVTCKNGKWIPQPKCLRPGEKMPEIEMKKTTSVLHTTPASVRTSIKDLPGLQPTKSTFSDVATSALPEETHAFSEIEESDMQSVISNSSHDNTVTHCSCLFNYSSPNVIAYAGAEQLKIGNRITEGCNVTFSCEHPGFHHLVGTSVVQCENCAWRNYEFPICQEPGQYDAAVFISSANNSLLSLTPSGIVNVPYGMKLNISCVIIGSEVWPDFVNLPSPFRTEYRYARLESGGYSLYTDIMIESAHSLNSGKYECASPHGRSNYIIIEIKEPLCPEIVNEDLNVTYSNRRTIHSQARFRCVDSLAVLDGPSEVSCLSTLQWSGDVPTCEYTLCPMLDVPAEMTVFYSKERTPNSQALFQCSSAYVLKGSSVITCLNTGYWSDLVPVCETVTCNIQSLMENLPEDVVPVDEDVTAEEIPYGGVLRLTCGQGNRIVVGTRNATCSKSGAWVIDKISCVLGCQPVVLPEDSKLIIEPSKNMYRFGEFVTFSCPPGYRLSSRMVRLLCMKDGWSEKEKDIPSCLSI